MTFMSNLISDELRLFKIRQSFEKQKIDNIVAAIDKQFDDAVFLPDLTGKSVAISAGSRGISNIGLMIKSIASNIKKRGGTLPKFWLQMLRDWLLGKLW